MILKVFYGSYLAFVFVVLTFVAPAGMGLTNADPNVRRQQWNKEEIEGSIRRESAEIAARQAARAAARRRSGSSGYSGGK
ncbi:hypothetical protein OAX78_02675 [Planctomycetota bacterium]|nr:hypothetical protein [Planctomycetota bacterium]